MVGAAIRWLRHLLVWLAAIAVAVFAVPAEAARIAVIPVRIELASTATFCSLHVSNQGTNDVALQVRGFAWSQGPDGSEQLGSADIRVNPSIFELTPGQKRLIRCSLPPQTGANESAYRLLIDELPRGNPEPGTMQTLLRISLPIFRKPLGAAPRLGWKVGDDGVLHLVNEGRRHVIVAKLVVSRAGQTAERLERGFYLLAGSRRTIAMAGSRGAITKVEAVTAQGQVEAVAKLED